MSADETMREEPALEQVVPEPKPEKPLNPAHAILAGAILSAVVTLVGVSLNIRSSERLSAERDKRDVAVAEANDLKSKVGDLEEKLNEALSKIPSAALGSSTAVPPTATPGPSAPPPSIVVVVSIPTVAPVASGAPSAAPTTRALPSSTDAPTTISPTTTTTTTTTTTPTTTTTTPAGTTSTPPSTMAKPT